MVSSSIYSAPVINQLIAQQLVLPVSAALGKTPLNNKEKFVLIAELLC